jgi:hypothetical protein
MMHVQHVTEHESISDQLSDSMSDVLFELGLDRGDIPGDPTVLQWIVDDFAFLRDVAWSVHQGLDAVVASALSGGFEGATADALREVVSGRLKTFVYNIARAFSLAREAVAEYRAVLVSAQRVVGAVVAQAGLPADDRRLAGLKGRVADQVGRVREAGAVMVRALQDAAEMVSQPIKVPSLFERIWKGVEKTLMVAAMVAGLLSSVVDGPLGEVAFGMSAAGFAMSVADYAVGRTSWQGLVLSAVGMALPGGKGVWSLEEFGAGLRGFLGRAGQAAGVLATPSKWAPLLVSGLVRGGQMPGLLLDAVKAVPSLIAAVPGVLKSLGKVIGQDFTNVAKWYPGLTAVAGAHFGYAVLNLGRLAGALFTPLSFDEIAVLGFRGAWAAARRRASWTAAARAFRAGWTGYGTRAALAGLDALTMLYTHGIRGVLPDGGKGAPKAGPGVVPVAPRPSDDPAPGFIFLRTISGRLLPGVPTSGPGHGLDLSGAPAGLLREQKIALDGEDSYLTTRGGLLVPVEGVLPPQSLQRLRELGPNDVERLPAGNFETAVGPYIPPRTVVNPHIPQPPGSVAQTVRLDATVHPVMSVVTPGAQQPLRDVPGPSRQPPAAPPPAPPAGPPAVPPVGPPVGLAAGLLAPQELAVVRAWVRVLTRGDAAMAASLNLSVGEAYELVAGRRPFTRDILERLERLEGVGDRGVGMRQRVQPVGNQLVVDAGAGETLVLTDQGEFVFRLLRLPGHTDLRVWFGTEGFVELGRVGLTDAVGGPHRVPGAHILLPDTGGLRVCVPVDGTGELAEWHLSSLGMLCSREVPVTGVGVPRRLRVRVDYTYGQGPDAVASSLHVLYAESGEPAEDLWVHLLPDGPPDGFFLTRPSEGEGFFLDGLGCAVFPGQFPTGQLTVRCPAAAPVLRNAGAGPVRPQAVPGFAGMEGVRDFTVDGAFAFRMARIRGTDLLLRFSSPEGAGMGVRVHVAGHDGVPVEVNSHIDHQDGLTLWMFAPSAGLPWARWHYNAVGVPWAFEMPLVGEGVPHGLWLRVEETAGEGARYAVFRADSGAVAEGFEAGPAVGELAEELPEGFTVTMTGSGRAWHFPAVGVARYVDESVTVGRPPGFAPAPAVEPVPQAGAPTLGEIEDTADVAATVGHSPEHMDLGPVLDIDMAEGDMQSLLDLLHEWPPEPGAEHRDESAPMESTPQESPSSVGLSVPVGESGAEPVVSPLGGESSAAVAGLADAPLSGEDVSLVEPDDGGHSAPPEPTPLERPARPARRPRSRKPPRLNKPSAEMRVKAQVRLRCLVRTQPNAAAAGEFLDCTGEAIRNNCKKAKVSPLVAAALEEKLGGSVVEVVPRSDGRFVVDSGAGEILHLDSEGMLDFRMLRLPGSGLWLRINGEHTEGSERARLTDEHGEPAPDVPEDDVLPRKRRGSDLAKVRLPVPDTPAEVEWGISILGVLRYRVVPVTGSAALHGLRVHTNYTYPDWYTVEPSHVVIDPHNDPMRGFAAESLPEGPLPEGSGGAHREGVVITRMADGQVFHLDGWGRVVQESSAVPTDMSGEDIPSRFDSLDDVLSRSRSRSRTRAGHHDGPSQMEITEQERSS